ncbi:17.8 kDa class I heat shock protein [Ziziphus jujuba]|uniref:17.8 kDa class I heat shock protein n=2 Tax=Ziziphus jujuba TaxID=326968 RepID=A0ABM3IK55_ZIZJJ|nr:17.8 kDa class I heat shock protein [Ziziphus jujuba]KAH7529449.1 hypothetical protein FEM48_Zijuj05G0185100 [Ziziphus jujuba var. spinosa]
MENKVELRTNRLYMEFEPYCIWHKKEDNDTLDVHLEGFKREQLKVRVNNARMLTISGERPLDDNNKQSFFGKQIKLGEPPLHDNNKWSRFSKQIPLADNINVSYISSKFSRGILSVVMPKKPEIPSMSISPGFEVVIQKETENAGGWMLKDKNMGVLVFLVLGFGIYVKCLCG